MRILEEGEMWKTGGTHLVGSIEVDYAQLETAFGEPILSEPDNKTHAEWRLETASGIVFTIYDWKQEVAPFFVKEWHIGSRYDKDFDFIKKAIIEVLHTVAKPYTVTVLYKTTIKNSTKKILKLLENYCNVGRIIDEGEKILVSPIQGEYGARYIKAECYIKLDRIKPLEQILQADTNILTYLL